MFGIQSIFGAYCLTGLKIISCDSRDLLFWNCHYFLEQPLCTAANMPWILLLHITVILLCQGRIQPHRAGVSLCWPHATVQHVQIWEKPEGYLAYSTSSSFTSMEPSLSSETVCCICVCICLFFKNLSLILQFYSFKWALVEYTDTGNALSCWNLAFFSSWFQPRHFAIFGLTCVKLQ